MNLAPILLGSGTLALAAFAVLVFIGLWERHAQEATALGFSGIYERYLASQAAFGDDMQSYQAARGIEDNRRHHSNSSYTVLKTQHFPEIRALSRSGSRTRP